MSPPTGGIFITWCGQNNLALKAVKTVDMVVDFRKSPAPPALSPLCDSPADTVEPLCFLWHRHHPEPQVGAEHQLPHQKSPAEDVPVPAAAEDVQPAKVNDGASLSPSSPPPSPSGALLPRTRADSSVLFALLRR